MVSQGENGANRLMVSEGIEKVTHCSEAIRELSFGCDMGKGKRKWDGIVNIFFFDVDAANSAPSSIPSLVLAAACSTRWYSSSCSFRATFISSRTAGP